MAPSVANQPTIRVLLFARYAELIGTEEIELSALGISTAGQVLARVQELPGGARIAQSVLIAVNLRQATRDSAVEAGDEVALLPPLAGG